MQLLLDVLRPRADEAQLAAAFGARAVHALHISAVVAHQALVCAVICERNAAPWASVSIAAISAAYQLMCAAAVDEQYALLAALDILLKLIPQEAAYIAVVPAAKLALHVNYLHFGKPHIVIAVFQREERVPPDARVIARTDVRRGGAEQQQTVILRAAELCNVARVIPWIVLGLISLFLLLVYYDRAQIAERRENRAACADNDPRFAVFNALPFVVPLGGRKATVHDGDIVPEMRRECAEHLRRQRNLRHQQQRRFPSAEA